MNFKNCSQTSDAQVFDNGPFNNAISGKKLLIVTLSQQNGVLKPFSLLSKHVLILDVPVFLS